MLHVLYRLCDGDRKRGERPLGFSKRKCLNSFLDSCGSGIFANIEYIIDGESPDWLMIEPLRTSKAGSAQSFWFAYNLAITYPKEDWVYFAEDDYMYAPEAITKLWHCIQTIPTDFISLYDHPDRYKSLPEHNLTDGKNDIYWDGMHHWRTIPSNTMTFAARVSSLIAGKALFDEWTNRDGFTVSWELFPRLLGLKGNSSHKMKMIGAIPSLATHCEIDNLAPGWKEQE